MSKAATAAVLVVGAKAVIDGDLTVGALVAFNMIMNQAVAPILRLSQLWQDFQQIQISVQRLGDILNAPPESQRLANANLPPAKGAIKVANLSFLYTPDGADVLKDINLEVGAGEVVGLVGRSGSGKSTLTKLVQRLYRVERGQILIDGIDIGQVDTAWLRRQDRRRAAGEPALQSLDPREYRARQPRHAARPRDRGRTARRRRRVHRQAAARL